MYTALNTKMMTNEWCKEVCMIGNLDVGVLSFQFNQFRPEKATVTIDSVDDGHNAEDICFCVL